MLKNILRAILLQKRTILTFLIMIVLLGSISYSTFPKEERPAVDLNTVALIISYQGLSSDEVERLIAEPLEREMMSLYDIDEIISVSKDGIVSFRISFRLDSKIQNISRITFKQADHLVTIKELYIFPIDSIPYKYQIWENYETFNLR